MKKGSGSWVCCLEWAALPSHSKPSGVPLLSVGSEGHGCRSATVTPQLRVFSADFHLCFYGRAPPTPSSSSSPPEYVCVPRV